MVPMTYGDILVIQGTGFLAWLVRIATGSRWTHTALCVGEGQIAEISAEFPARVVPLRYSRYSVLRYSEVTVARQKALVAWARAKAGSRYDWWAIASMVLRLFGPLRACLNAPRRYICTEFVIEAYRAVGINLVHTCEPVTPGELMRLPGLVRVGDAEVE